MVFDEQQNILASRTKTIVRCFILEGDRPQVRAALTVLICPGGRLQVFVGLAHMHSRAGESSMRSLATTS